MKTCRECGELFTPKAAYHHTCLLCWKQQARRSSAGREVTVDDVLTAHERGRALEREEWRAAIERYDSWLTDAYRKRELALARVRGLESDLLMARADAAEWRSLFYAEMAQRRAAPAIPPDVLKRLIHLCHPDKHADSRAAVEATQWLLQQRDAAAN